MAAHCIGTLWPVQIMERQTMKATDSKNPKSLVDDAIQAANDDAIENAGRPAGWDPFEVWRTRVKAVRSQRDDSGKSTSR